MERVIRAPRGVKLNCKGWPQEAALRMLMNNLDVEVAENPAELVVYGGSGKAARNWESYDALVRTLKDLEGDETLLVQSGKPVAVFPSHPDAPRVILANSLLVPHWANWSYFRELERRGLIMYGQMTAGSWIYIGTQGILQGTYETFGALARRHFDGSLKGRLVLTAGLGGMGGAQPLAVTMNEGICIAVDVDQTRIDRRLGTGYCDRQAATLSEALALTAKARQAGEALSVALLGNAADILPEFVRRGVVPDVVTDQTPAHDTLHGYVPHGLDLQTALRLRINNPEEYQRRARSSIAAHVEAMVRLQDQGAVVFDYGNNIRQVALDEGFKDAFSFPGFVPAYIRPLFCQGKGPFRWVALSGDPADIARTDRVILEEFSYDEHLIRWIRLAGKKVHYQGLPARICWLGYGERARFGAIINDLVAKGELKAPVVIGRDHLVCGSVASPNRETEAMLDGSDAVADWPVLNALLNCAGGATWVSVHHGGGVGIGYSLHAGMVIVADGTPEASRRLQRVLNTDPGLGIVRHADAGYEEAKQNARCHNLKMPML